MVISEEKSFIFIAVTKTGSTSMTSVLSEYGKTYAHFNKKETGIPKLKVKSNNVAGFFVEVSKSYTKQVPDYFKRRQTLVNAERYTTKELDKFEKEVLYYNFSIANSLGACLFYN